ncbi:hypothetical protein TUMEXPCC7403_14160 [Tumidithrix helvetica PCC 7403]
MNLAKDIETDKTCKDGSYHFQKITTHLFEKTALCAELQIQSVANLREIGITLVITLGIGSYVCTYFAG